MNSQLSGVKPCTLCMIEIFCGKLNSLDMDSNTMENSAQITYLLKMTEKLAMDTALYLINVATGKTNHLLNMLHQGTTVLYWQNCQLN